MYLALEEYFKHKESILIGREPSCDVVIKDKYVSRKHCKITRQGEKYLLEDLHSTNGTFINGKRINTSTYIDENDELLIGFQTLRIKESVRAHDAAPALETHHLHVQHKNRPLLHPLSIAVQKGEFVAVMGPSGCGKSTFIKSITNFIPSSGEVFIHGLNARKYEKYVFSKIGYVGQQDYFHSELTVWDTIYYAAKIKIPDVSSHHNIRDIIHHVLEKMNLNHPDHLSKKVKFLSGGEKKRLAIAIELLANPAILILDEPTSPLDPETIREFLQYLKKVQEEGTTILMVTHKPEDIHYADKIMFLGKGGYLCYYGSKENVLSYFQKNDYLEVYELLSRPESVNQFRIHKTEVKTKTHSDLSESAFSSSTSVFRQIYYLLWITLRYAQYKWRHGPDFWALVLLQPVLIPVLISFIFEKFQISHLFIMSITVIWFGISNSSREIVDEWPLYFKEKKYGIRPETYYLSKLFILSLLTIVQVVVLVYTTSFLQQEDNIRLFSPLSYIGVLSLNGILSVMMGLLISSLFTSSVKVISITPLILIPQLLLSGVIAPLDSPVKSYLGMLTISRWSTELLCKIQDEHSTLIQSETCLYNPQYDTTFQWMYPCKKLPYCPGAEQVKIKIPKEVKVNYKHINKLKIVSLYQLVSDVEKDTLLVTDEKNDTIPLLSSRKMYKVCNASEQLKMNTSNALYGLIQTDEIAKNIFFQVVLGLLLAFFTIKQLNVMRG